MAELEASLGPSTLEGHTFQVARVWQLARREAADQVHCVVDAVVSARLSTSSSGSRASRPAPVIAVKAMPAKVRTMLVTGTGPVDAPQTVAAMHGGGTLCQRRGSASEPH